MEWRLNHVGQMAQSVQDYSSSVQHLGGNIPYSSGRSKIFGEYDKDGNLIKIFRYDAQQFSYRVLKYNFKGFYFR